jgi:hypothetical protein
MFDEGNKGKRVKLTYTNDPYTQLKSGDMGTYQGCLDGRQHCIKWDSGSSLMLIEGTDSFEFIEEKPCKS